MSDFEALALIGFAVLVFMVYTIKEKRLQDPARLDSIFPDQMLDVTQVQQDALAAVLLRQSGGIYRDLGQFGRKEDAFSEVQKSFRRAGIDAVHVLENKPFKFQVIRLHHSHGGKAEGKKLGGAVITVVP